MEADTACHGGLPGQAPGLAPNRISLGSSVPSNAAPSNADVTSQPPSPAAVDAALIEQEEATEAAHLGLSRAKAKAAPKGKVKKSAEDLVKEELSKLQVEVDALIAGLSGFPSTPSGQALGRADRMIGRALKQFKGNHNFQATSTCEALAAFVELLRSCCKVPWDCWGHQGTS